MIWVGWRLQRTETLVAAGLLVALALLIVPTGIEMANAYHSDGIANCLAANASSSCNQAIESFNQRFDSLNNFVAWFTLVPGLIGVLLAAPFVLELENGTYRLAWTQSITRRRWIATKLGLPVVAALIAALVMILLITWWRTPLVHIRGRMDNSVFDFEGTVAFGYIAFALGLALAVGAVWRRAVPAFVVAFAGYTAARVFVDTWLRQRLVTPLTVTWPVSSSSHAPPRSSITPGSSPRRRVTSTVTCSGSSPRPAGVATAGRSAWGRTGCTPSTSLRAASGSCRASRPPCSVGSRSR